MRGRKIATVLVLLMTNLGFAQFPFQTQANTDDLFLLAPRPLTRMLREGEIAIQEGRYADGISALSSLLLADPSVDALPDDLRGQDYFMEPGARGLFSKSVKGEAIRLLGELPREGRRTLQIQLGVTAEQELVAAIEAKDFERIGNVARKYPHTEAAYDATILTAQFKLTVGYPLAAAALLKELLEYPAARERYGPKLAWATAKAWITAGNTEAAVLTLRMASRDFSGASLNLEGRQIPLDVETDWAQLLNREVERDSTFTDRLANDAWLVTGGSPERNAVSEAGMPLPTERWMRQIHSSLPEQEALQRQRDAESQKGRVLLPKFELRMVGDLVLTKTTNASLLAIDFETGVIKWPCFFNNVPAQITNMPYRSFGSTDSAVSSELQNRVWGSSAFGKFSCDQQRLYFVSDPTDRFLSSGNVYRGNRTADDVNYLEGASFAAQGAIMWRVGGADGVDEPRLAGTYFLGPPLPYQGDLYTLAEVNGETMLVVLDATSGKLRWKQQLVHSSTPLVYDNERRSQALSPTIAEGVVLCPTGVGAVVAVDLLTRSLRWGATYTTNRPNENNMFRQRGAFGDGSEFSPLDKRWQEPAMIAQDGVVLISPPESDDMFCRDILTGTPLLTPQRRNSSRYVAGLRNGSIVVVGERHAMALQMGSGKPLWECQFPFGMTLAGKGLWQEQSLMLPLSDRHVIKIDTDTGRILEQVQVAQPLGNLFAYRNQLLSVSESAVVVYYTRDALTEQVAERLQQNPLDTWALNQQSQLAMANNDLEQAVQSLIKSFELDPSSADTRYLLVELLLSGLAADFDKFEALAQRYAEVVEYGPQRFRFLQQLSLGKIRAGKHLAAFQSLLELVPQTGSSFSVTQNRQREIQLSANHVVDSDTWIATELARAFENATTDDQRAMRDLLSQELSSIENTMVPLRREKLRFLQWLPAANGPLLELSAALLGGEEQCVAEQLLQPVLLSGNEQQRELAIGLLRRPAYNIGRFGGYSLDSEAFDSNFDGAQPRLNANGAADDSTRDRPDATAPFDWNSGKVVMNASNESRYHFGSVIDVISQRYGRPNLSIALSGATVVVRNGHGEDRAHFDFPRASADATDVFTRATIRGGLLLLETSSEMVAFDMYRGLVSGVDALLWRHSLFSPSAGPSRAFEQPDVSSINTPFGITLSQRQMPGKQQAIVGPLTPNGVLLQVGTQLILLDSLTGKAVWTRGGYDDRIRLSGRGAEIAVVNPSLGKVEILDCRDGARLRSLEYRGDWRHWFSHSGTMVDFSETRTVPPEPATVRVWNAFTGEDIKRLRLPVGTRAAACEGRFLVMLEPSGKLHYFDLENPDEITQTVQQVTAPEKFETLSAQLFENRLVLLTSSTKGRQVSQDMVPVNGIVFAIETETGELSWGRAGRLFGLQFPLSQPRLSPFMVAYRINPKIGLEHRATLALVDLRNGRLAYSSDSLPLRANVGFAMSLHPAEQTIEMGLGARSLRFTITDQPRPPSPVFSFGSQRTQPDIEKGFDNLFP